VTLSGSLRRVSRLTRHSGACSWLSVLVCRGCCCGTDKHPSTPHREQVAILRRAALAAGARFAVTDCLDACAHSNVVVLRRRVEGATETVWLGRVLRARDTALLAAWITRGGPIPGALRGRVLPAGELPTAERRCC
jgi:hypothetical protein